MNGKWYFLLIVAFVLGFALAWMIFGDSVTGSVVTDVSQGTYSWTTAICNDKHECIDVSVECVAGKATSVKPISSLQQFADDWEDSRFTNKTLCG